MSISKESSRQLLERQIHAIQELKGKNRFPVEFEPWRQQTLRVIKKIFGEKSDHAKQFDEIAFDLRFFSSGTPKSRFDEAYQEGLAIAEATLKSFIQELDLFPNVSVRTCPKCHSSDVAFLEIDEVGSKKYRLSIPQLAGAEWHTGKKVAYYSCNSCKRVFFTEPFKA
jgi:hypothetical protein